MRVINESPPLTEHICRNAKRTTRYVERPLFRSITTGGAVKPNRLSGHGINEVIKRRVQAVGLNPKDFGGHSLRAGFVTQAFRSGADSRSIRRQTGHKGDAILDIYDRENAPMANNAVTRIGL
jgi:integrase